MLTSRKKIHEFMDSVLNGCSVQFVHVQRQMFSPTDVYTNALNRSYLIRRYNAYINKKVI